MSGSWYYLTSVEPDENMYRFYHLAVQPGLFNNFYLVKRWGRIGTEGQTIKISFETESEAIKELEKLLQTKEKHGYLNDCVPRTRPLGKE